MLARQDLNQYHNGVSLLENFQILPQGGVERRPGTLFVGEARDNIAPIRLIPFVYSQSQSYILVFCDGYIHFYTNGGGRVDNTYYLNKLSFNQSISKHSSPHKVIWNNDGTKMYETATNPGYIYEYDLSTPFDISTANFNQKMQTQNIYPYSIAWSNDGLKLFEVDGGYENDIYQYVVSVAFDISTATLDATIKPNGENTKDIVFNGNGTKLYEVQFSDQKIYQYTLDTAFDITTAKLETQFSTTDTGPSGIAWNDDGTFLYELGYNYQKIYQYEVDKPFDITNAKLKDSIATQDQDPTGITWGNNGKSLYETGYNSDAIYQSDISPINYELSHPYNDEDLNDLRFVQSNDVLFIVHPDYKLRRLERRDHTDWAFVTPDLDKGPYLVENTDDDHTITPGDIGGGEANLVASKDTFTAENVGGLFKLKHPRTDNQLNGSFSGTGTSNELAGEGEWKIVTHGTWTGTLELQRSLDGGSTWQSYRVYSSSDDNNALDTGLEENEASFRLEMTTYTSGTCEYTFAIFDYYTESVIRITGYTDAKNVTGDILEPTDNALKSDADGNSTAIWAEGAWSDRRGWPSTICFFEQRLLMAGTSHRPQTIWGSKIDRYEDFEIGTNDDDPYAYAFASDQRNPINWLLPTTSLLVGTEGGIWRIGGGNNFRDPITPTNVLARREVVEGTTDAFAMQDRVLFVGRERKSLTELSYNYAEDQYVPNDMSILVPHILQGKVKDFAFISEPYDTAWFLPEDESSLKSFTREPQHKISGWGNHSFDPDRTYGIKSIASIPGTYGDELFVAVGRIINGQSKQYIELIQPHHWQGNVKSAVHLDSSLEYHQPSASKTFSGLDHLEGEKISVWVDGATHPNVTVNSGEITLDYEAYDVIAGLNYTSRIKTMPLPFTPDKKGRTPQVVVDLYRTILGYIRTVGIENYAAPDEGELETLVTRQVLGFMNSGIDIFTGPLERQIEAQLDRRIEVEVMQYDPAPLTLLALHLKNVVLE